MWKRFFELLRKYFVLSMLLFSLAFSALYYLWIHRRPFTQNAFVVANTRTVTSLVPGYIKEIHVENNQYVKNGAPLMTIYRDSYRFKRDQALHARDAARATVKKLAASIAVAEAVIEQRAAEAANAKYLSDQAAVMYKGLAVSQAYAEEKQRACQSLEAQLRAAKHNLSALRHESEEAAATARKLEAEYSLAELYLSWTIVRAQADGCVTNMYISPGAYVEAGSPLFAFIDTGEWFVQGNFKETELSHLKVGQKAEIWLWQYPGKTFHGTVLSIGWGVERRGIADFSGMPVVEKENEWFLLPQRFPVQIRIDDPDPAYPLHPGGSAFVAIDAPAIPIRQFLWQLFQI